MTDQNDQTDRPEVDDPRVLALAKARQQMANENPFNAGFCPPWDGLTAQEQRLSLLDARNYLRAALNAGLVATPAVPAPATDQAALRQQVIEALYEARRPGLGGMTEAEAVAHMADAVLSVLPAPFEAALPSQTGPKADSKAADRAAVLDRIRALHLPKPDGSGFPDGLQCRTCSHDGGDGYQYLVPWPCPTVEVVDEELRRMADETQQPETETLATMFEGLHHLLATSSRDWSVYRVDAWLWAVLCGWDCEQAEHDDTCTHGALEETAAMHGWDDDTVAKARRYRAAVRAVTEAAAVQQPKEARP